MMAERHGIIVIIAGKECSNTKTIVEGKMDNHSKIVIAILSIQLTISGIVISHLCYKLGYEQGRASVYNSFAETGSEGTCYVPGGCDDIKSKIVKRHSK